jgi:hypothetical protein
VERVLDAPVALELVEVAAVDEDDVREREVRD